MLGVIHGDVRMPPEILGGVYGGGGHGHSDARGDQQVLAVDDDGRLDRGRESLRNFARLFGPREFFKLLWRQVM